MNLHEEKISKYGNYTIFIKQILHDKAINEVVRIYNVIKAEKVCTKLKFKNEMQKLVDAEARNKFKGGVTNSKIARYNQHVSRNEMINGNNAKTDCLRCIEKEIQSYAV